MAGDGQANTPGDLKAVERLRRYWTEGAGALKIRWGVSGDWQRCVDHLSKYMTPENAKGYCQNLHERATGMSTAEHAKMDRMGKGKGGKH